MNDWLYHILAFGLHACLWGGDVTGEERLPKRGPAVLVANHLGAWGPIAAVSSMPRRLYPWVIADMMDAKRAPDYLRLDFVERQLHLKKPLSSWIANAISKLSVPLLTGAGCIPVHSNFEEMLIPFHQSVNRLVQGGFILIFPEDPAQPLNPVYQMSPFKKGFVRLGEFYFQRTGRALTFYPLAVHRRRREVQVGAPVTHNPRANPVGERLRVKHTLERMIHEMLEGTNRDVYLHVPAPR
ncbi:MAG: hypothetical protein DPW18_10245 [Chloroflexi bacterium]|nr:hypothetical protein [Chloroflexota bacterium]MDL1944498.1 hypothetical protein [Chloroflexi bacterium CFX2]